MKVTCIQMDIQLAQPAANLQKAEAMIAKAMEDAPDVLVLPESWNTGVLHSGNFATICDRDGSMVKEEIGGLAKRYGVNIVAGSVANMRGGKLYNTAMVFDRKGDCIASYDKAHLFSPMGEDKFYTPGDHICRFQLDGRDCGIIICYDLRFPELTRKLAVAGMDMLFVVSQWPKVRLPHLKTLTAARAIENQMFLCCCNACGKTEDTAIGGHSHILDPWGNLLGEAGEGEDLLTAECDFSILKDIRTTINVFADRRPELYGM